MAKMAKHMNINLGQRMDEWMNKINGITEFSKHPLKVQDR